MNRILTIRMSIFYKFFIIHLLFIPYTLKACTAFTIKDDKQVFLAKNLDWDISNGIILINKKGISKTTYSNNVNKLSWVSKYGSVTFNQFGKEFPLGGMNEMGLVIEELNSWGETPKSGSKYEINEFQWTQFCLDNFANVNELLEGIDNIIIVPMFINLHYLISDSFGNTTIIEFYNNKTYIYNGENISYPILSNNHYENSLKYLSNFKGFGGNMEVKSDNTSNERFVKVASLLNEKKQTNLKKETSFEILDYVSQSDTQWSIVYDISNKSIHFKTSQNTTIKTIELSDLDFSCKTYTSFLNVNNDKTIITGGSFKKLKPDYNKELLIDVFNKLKDHKEVSKKEFLSLADYGNSIKCK